VSERVREGGRERERKREGGRGRERERSRLPEMVSNCGDLPK
jgi:hypothetical protein